ncbi:hypothetical protein HOY82DRAFT_668765 [Tuber indicum]|nr:hypothetical protein HOY82DRAFT_668765 [Tuber indicum]
MALSLQDDDPPLPYPMSPPPPFTRHKLLRPNQIVHRMAGATPTLSDSDWGEGNGKESRDKNKIKTPTAAANSSSTKTHVPVVITPGQDNPQTRPNFLNSPPGYDMTTDSQEFESLCTGRKVLPTCPKKGYEVDDERLAVFERIPTAVVADSRGYESVAEVMASILRGQESACKSTDPEKCEVSLERRFNNDPTSTGLGEQQEGTPALFTIPNEVPELLADSCPKYLGFCGKEYSCCPMKGTCCPMSAGCCAEAGSGCFPDKDGKTRCCNLRAEKLCSSRTCIPKNTVCCRDGNYCGAGSYCVKGGCCRAGNICKGKTGGKPSGHDPRGVAPARLREV